jgi:biopolymer transport protein ExbD
VAENAADEESAINEINVTPLVDISLVLVIIFMVTAPMVVQSGIVVNASKVTESFGKSTRNESVQIKITKKSILVNGNKVSDESFYPTIKAMLDKNKKKLVTVTCDRDVQHGRLVSVLDTSKMAGAKSIALMDEGKKNK